MPVMNTQHLETNTQTIERLTAELNAALSRAEKAEKCCTEKDKALQLAKDVTSHGFLPNPNTGRFDQTHFDVHSVIDAALSSTCGSGYVSVEELRPTIEFLDGLLGVTSTFLDNKDGHYTKITQAEKNRLIALIEKSK